MKLDNLHHAYIVKGNNDGVLEFLSDIGVETKANPNLWQESFETLGVDDARSFKSREQKKAIGLEKKFFIISASFITTEAQNALLKVFEEPTENTHIFLVVPNTHMILPTLLSRVDVIDLKKEKRGKDDVKQFIESSLDKRLNFLKEIIEEKDKTGALDFLSQLENYLSRDVKGNKGKLKDVLKMKSYLYSKSPQVKSIVEYIAYTV